MASTIATETLVGTPVTTAAGCTENFRAVADAIGAVVVVAPPLDVELVGELDVVPLEGAGVEGEGLGVLGAFVPEGGELAVNAAPPPPPPPPPPPQAWTSSDRPRTVAMPNPRELVHRKWWCEDIGFPTPRRPDKLPDASRSTII
jgi:hypothetical protein